MVQRYRNKFYLFLASFLVFFILAGLSYGADPNSGIGALFIIMAWTSFLAAMIYSARSKGYSFWVGLLLSFMWLIGLVILAFLPDKTVANTESEKVEISSESMEKGQFLNSMRNKPYLWISVGAGILLVALFFIFYQQQNDLLQKQQEQINLLQQKQQEQAAKQASAEISVEDAVKQWQPRVAFIYCEFRYTTNVLYEAHSGSGTLEQIITSDGVSHYWVVTNKHVLLDSSLKYGPRSCLLVFPGFSSVLIVGNDAIMVFDKFDGGYLSLDQVADEYVKKVAPGHISCIGDPAVGEKIVILGYPGIGSQPGQITATVGIISGRDTPYWLTDAKIEHGDSGGLAVSLKRNCGLGIPTGVATGTVESIGRILDMHQILQ